MPAQNQAHKGRTDAQTGIRDRLESWARWRHYKHRLGYGETVLGRMMRGVPGINCRSCNGRGRIPTNGKGGKHYIDCPVCDASGRIDLATSHHKINPAFIPSTGHLDDSAIYCAIDYAYCHLTRIQQDAIYHEYIHPVGGSQHIKADRMGITQQAYSAVLSRAIKRIDELANSQRAECDHQT